jgi:hypothetical protein
MSMSNGERIATVDAFLDVDTARAAINQALKVVFEQDHIVAMWWSAENPRLGGRTPESLWNANPIKDPTARDAVYEVASTTAIWRAPTVQEHAARYVAKRDRADTIGMFATKILLDFPLAY